ncbi:unnamed protein product, partial [Mycena citricolor]
QLRSVPRLKGLWRGCLWVRGLELTLRVRDAVLSGARPGFLLCFHDVVFLLLSRPALLVLATRGQLLPSFRFRWPVLQMLASWPPCRPQDSVGRSPLRLQKAALISNEYPGRRCLTNRGRPPEHCLTPGRRPPRSRTAISSPPSALACRTGPAG